MGPAGLDDQAPAADIATEASLALELSRQIARLDERIFDHDGDTDPTTSCFPSPVSASSSPARSAAGSATPPVHQPGRGPILLRAHPHQHSSGLTDAVGGPTNHGDARLREALFLAADHPARPTHPGRPRPAAQVPDRPPPHPWALGTIATVLCTRIVACLRNNTPYQIRDVDGSPITPPRAERPSPRATRSHPKSCRPPNDQQPPQPPTRMGRAHRPRSRQALHDAAHPTASLNPARHLDNQ